MTDGETDGETNESDFIGRCPTNVEHPIQKSRYLENETIFLQITHQGLVYDKNSFVAEVIFNHFP